MNHSNFTFRLHDGKGGYIVWPGGATLDEVRAMCDGQFGHGRLAEVKHG